MLYPSSLVPTHRAVIDLNRNCNAKCIMCYYTYDPSRWSKPLDQVKRELVKAKERGNESVDFTGGEPTVYPHMEEVIRFSEQLGLHTCIITNALSLERIKRLVDAGCREWLVSLHGFEENHDFILGVKGAWDKVNRSIEFLKSSNCFIRVNCTLIKQNLTDLPKLARFYMEAVKARVVNFINFNPHYHWGEHEKREVIENLQRVQARVSEIAPKLREALTVLEENNIWVNVRYFPFCLLKGFEANICNNPQVMFDPYEWDYGVSPKDPDTYLQFGRRLQERINTKEGACGRCGILNVCGGIHKNYAKLYGTDELIPYEEKIDHPYHFKTDLEADIVIPAFKVGENLERLLNEILKNTVPPYNLILISKEQSASKNRNYGLNRSKSPYVIMCDDDIRNLPFGWNRRLIQTLKENPELIAVSARLMNADGTPGRNTANNFNLSDEMVLVDMIPTACCIFRKTDLRFDERYIRAGWEDTDFFMQMKQNLRGKFAIDNRVKVVHLNEEKLGGGVGNRENMELFFKKWGKESKSSDQVQDKFREVLEQKDYISAIELIEERIKREGITAQSYNELGCISWELGDPEIAIRCFTESLRLDPKNNDYLLNLIEASYHSGSYKDLEQIIRDKIGSRPESKEYRYILADCLFRQKRFDEAKEILNTIIDKRDEKKEINDVSQFNNLPYITKRGCIDVGHICDLDCIFCYHRYEDRSKRRFLSKEEIMARLKRDRDEFALEITDFTGGEPTLHPHIVEIVKFGAEIGNRICIITHGLWRDLDKIDAMIENGLYEFLISIHGTEEDHDSLVQKKGAFEQVLRSIEHLEKRQLKWRVNCVANRSNMKNLPRYAEIISSLSHPPYNANFIVFSPLSRWATFREIEFQARHSELAPYLMKAIDIFNSRGIWVNVRYFPMCMMPGYEQHVTCFPQICYDPFEWDYRSYVNMSKERIMEIYRLGKRLGVYGEQEGHIFFNTWSLIQSRRCYRKGDQCQRCALKLICDGVATQYMNRFGFDELKSIEGDTIWDPIYFRKIYPLAVRNGYEVADRSRSL